MYSIALTRSAERELGQLPPAYQESMARRLAALEGWPDVRADVRVLKGSEEGTHRLRVGVYRAILIVVPEEQRIVVVRIGHRGKVYR